MVSIRSLSLAIAVLGSARSIDGLEFVKVVDSTTSIPGTKTPFFLDAIEPGSCDLGTVFVGHVKPGEQSGLYAANGAGISVLVDESTALPTSPGFFVDINRLSCDGSRVAFSAEESSNGQRGVFEWNAGALGAIATIATALPGTSHPVAGLGSPKVAGTSTSFRGLEAVVSVDSLFLQDESGVVVEVADTQVVPPGQTLPFSVLTPGDLEGDFVFRGLFSDFSSGIYRFVQPGGLEIVADYSTPIDGSPGVYLRNLGVPKTSAAWTVFGSSTTVGGSGVFVASEGSVRVLVPHLQPLPSGGVLSSVEKTDIDQGIVAFIGIAEGETRRRLLLRSEDALEEALSTQRLFDGKPISNYTFSLENSRLAVWVLFNDGSTGIYSAIVGQGSSVTEVPALRNLGLGALTCLLAIAGILALRKVTRLGL